MIKKALNLPWTYQVLCIVGLLYIIDCSDMLYMCSYS